jgi:RHS repeat-associated protein
VRSISTTDGNGVTSATWYYFGGGYFHIGERDFRGFSYASVTAPDGVVRHTWFHQGNGVSAAADDPTVAVGYTKGKPYRERTSDPWDPVTLTDGAYSERRIAYWIDADGVAPYFTPRRQVDVSSCNINLVCGRRTRIGYGHDQYGNIVREDQYGDIDDPGDDRTVVRSFSPNTVAWLVSLPYSETVYEGTYPSLKVEEIDPAHQVARTDTYYDGVTDCSTASTLTTPTRGLPTRTVQWLNGGTSPEARSAYDTYGNVVCVRDPNGNVDTYAYDATGVFRTTTLNALGQPTSIAHYGVQGVPRDGEPFGAVKTITDANGATTTYHYDGLGRVLREIAPNGQFVSTSYVYVFGSASGGVGTQRVERTTSDGRFEVRYFDGFERTFLEKRRGGPSGRLFATKTTFDTSGRIASKCLPYIEAAGSPACPLSTTFTYDTSDRPVQVANPDGTVVRACYDDVTGAGATLDPNGHLRRQVRSVSGQVTRVDEYQETYGACTTAVGTPYATTSYEYDVMSRLHSVTDAGGAVTEVSYDTLGRRIALADPNLGTFYYGYDAAGNVLWERDARGSVVSYQYDQLNRRRYKDYPTGADVAYTYDDPTIPFSVGRLSTMTDGTGVTRYTYDVLGRSSSVTRSIAGTSYATGAAYDTAGRVQSVSYPDGSSVGYTYDPDGLLKTVSGGGVTYASFEGYDALGQVGSIQYGNQVTTTYSYWEAASRLRRIRTTRSDGAVLDDVSYAYDDVGNVTGIDDSTDAASTQVLAYDGLDRLETATSTAYGSLQFAYSPTGNILQKEGVSYQYSAIQPHRVTSTSDGGSFSYDANGNMIQDGQRKLSYDFDNRPLYVKMQGATVSFAYDGDGTRVRKVSRSASVLYIGKLFECETPSAGAATCTRNVFAGNLRVAAVRSDGQVSYFHGDNLGSTRLVTKENGQVAERIRYRPFGEALQDSAAAASRYKFTGQEFDAETGLYFYGARYYDPHLGRFLSPDSVVSDQLDPQLLNRYSYVRNNPFKYTDPTGHVLVTITYVVGTVAAEAIFYSAAVAMTSYTALAIIGDWDVERGWDRTVDAGEDAYDWTDRELGVAGERLDQFGGWMGNRIEGVGASMQPSHVSSGPGMMAAHSSSEAYNGSAQCFAQLKCRPTRPGSEMDHTAWWVQARSGIQYMVTSGYEMGQDPPYLKMWVSEKPTDMEAGVCWSSGLSSGNCAGVDRLLNAARAFPQNSVLYYWKGPNSNTAARLVGEAGGFFPPMPNRARGWDYPLSLPKR